MVVVKKGPGASGLQDQTITVGRHYQQGDLLTGKFNRHHHQHPNHLEALLGIPTSKVCEKGIGTMIILL